MFGTYKENDVTILLKDISGIITPLPSEERERIIQNGGHYSEMLPIEYEPTTEYIKIFKRALQEYAGLTAAAVGRAADLIIKDKGENVVLVSLARAGTPIGILIKRYIKYKYGVDVQHYTISIIRDKGIDKNAMKYILSRHSAEDLQFVDGWTGKGVIQGELNKAMKDFKGVNPGLAVLSDPANVAEKCGTYDDFLIASSCLNATVSGLLSRTFSRPDVIGENDYHGSAFYRSLKDRDMTYEFIDSVASKFSGVDNIVFERERPLDSGIVEVNKIGREFGINDVNLIKPSIGETTRVLLRRIPWRILVWSLEDEKHLGHIYQLAKEKNVEVIQYPLNNYKACGLIKQMADT